MRAGTHPVKQSALVIPQITQSPGTNVPMPIQLRKPAAHTASQTAIDAGPAAAAGMSIQMGRIFLASQLS